MPLAKSSILYAAFGIVALFRNPAPTQCQFTTSVVNIWIFDIDFPEDINPPELFR